MSALNTALIKEKAELWSKWGFQIVTKAILHFENTHAYEIYMHACSEHGVTDGCISARVCCWISICLAEQKSLHRKCFSQLLGVSFSTLRPTKRHIAATSRDSSTQQMLFSLNPAIPKHSSHALLLDLDGLTNSSKWSKPSAAAVGALISQGPGIISHSIPWNIGI